MNDPTGASAVLFPRWLFWPVVVGLALRLVWAGLVPAELTSDAFIYHHGAVSLAEGKGFLIPGDGASVGDAAVHNGYWPVGYSAFLALFYWLFGATLSVGVGVNVVVSALTVWATGLAAGRLLGPRLGSGTAWLVALYPGLVGYVSVIASENLFLLLLALYLVAALDRIMWRSVLFQGVVLGLAIAVRPTALVMPLITAMAVLALGLGRWLGPALLRCVGVVVLGLLFALPVALRNQDLFGKFSFTSFNGGCVLWMGNHDGPSTTVLPEYTHAMNVVERNAALQKEAVEFIKANPLTFLKRCALRTVQALQSETIAVVWNPGLNRVFGDWVVTPAKALMSGVWWLVGAGALVGFVRLLRGRSGVPRGRLVGLLLLAGAAAHSIPFIVIDSQNRYHMPLLPFLFPAAAVGFAWVLSRRAAGAKPAPAEGSP